MANLYRPWRVIVYTNQICTNNWPFLHVRSHALWEREEEEETKRFTHTHTEMVDIFIFSLRLTSPFSIVCRKSDADWRRASLRRPAKIAPSGRISRHTGTCAAKCFCCCFFLLSSVWNFPAHLSTSSWDNTHFKPSKGAAPRSTHLDDDNRPAIHTKKDHPSLLRRQGKKKKKKNLLANNAIFFPSDPKRGAKISHHPIIKRWRFPGSEKTHGIWPAIRSTEWTERCIMYYRACLSTHVRRNENFNRNKKRRKKWDKKGRKSSDDGYKRLARGGGEREKKTSFRREKNEELVLKPVQVDCSSEKSDRIRWVSRN